MKLVKELGWEAAGVVTSIALLLSPYYFDPFSFIEAVAHYVSIAGSILLLLLGIHIVRKAARLIKNDRFGERIEVSSKGSLPLSGNKRVERLDIQPNQLPTLWKPEELAIQLRNLENRPSVVSIFVSSIIDRFIIGQDDETARSRMAFLRTKLEEIKISRELQTQFDDLEFRQVGLEIQKLEMENKKKGLMGKGRRDEELADLKHKREILTLQLELDRLEQNRGSASGFPPKATGQSSDGGRGNGSTVIGENDVSNANTQARREASS